MHKCHAFLIPAPKISVKIKNNNHMGVRKSSADRSDLRHIGMTVCSIKLGSREFNHIFIVCKNLVHSFILGLDFAKCFRIGIDGNSHDQHIYI